MTLKSERIEAEKRNYRWKTERGVNSDTGFQNSLNIRGVRTQGKAVSRSTPLHSRLPQARR